MANVDQAEGLRRILSLDKSRFVAFLSALPCAEKNATLVNLSVGLAKLGNDVLLLDMQHSEEAHSGVLDWLKTPINTSLFDVVQQQLPLDWAISMVPQGFKVARFCDPEQSEALYALSQDSVAHLNHLVGQLGEHADMVLVDASLNQANSFMVDRLDEAEVVMLVAHHPDSIKAAYTLIKRMHSHFGRRSYGILVSSENEAQGWRVYRTMAQVAKQFLSVPLHFMGCIPQDDYLRRATLSGITVLDAFPKAMASVAFSKLAQHMLYGDMCAVSCD